MCVWVFCLHICVCPVCTAGALRAMRRSRSWGGCERSGRSGDWNAGLWRNSQHSESPSHLPQPRVFTINCLNSLDSLYVNYLSNVQWAKMFSRCVLSFLPGSVLLCRCLLISCNTICQICLLFLKWLVVFLEFPCFVFILKCFPLIFLYF